MFDLTISRGGEGIYSVPIDRDSFTIGRAGTNDLRLPDPTVSRHQCQLLIQDHKIRVEDKSGKGTNVNGKLIAEAELHPGDILTLGALMLTLSEWKEEIDTPTLVRGGTDQVSVKHEQAEENLVLSGLVDGSSLNISITQDNFSIGSNSGNNLVLKDPHVSSFHCRVFRKNGKWFIRDLESTNGTKVNELPIVEVQLVPHAMISIGTTHLTAEFQSPEESRVAVLCDLISADPAMESVFERIRKAGPTEQTVLITGESGTGKELAARAIYQLSNRSERQMVSINCAQFAKELVESELFGHEKGAFTGAQGQRKGVFEQSDGGTIFLDEIGELSLDLQAKLLRTLESGEIRRVGSNTPIKVDVRVIAATNRSLPDLVQREQFREDLYYRIHVVNIELPPLRNRPLDIPLLAHHFLRHAARKTKAVSISPVAMKQLVSYSYPGNVRELKNLINTAAILAARNEIRPKDLEFCPPSLDDKIDESKVYFKGTTMNELEKQYFQQVLVSTKGNRNQAAKILGIPRTTLISRLNKFRIE